MVVIELKIAIVKWCYNGGEDDDDNDDDNDLAQKFS